MLLDNNAFRAFVKSEKRKQKLTIVTLAAKVPMSTHGLEYILYGGGTTLETAAMIARALGYELKCEQVEDSVNVEAQ